MTNSGTDAERVRGVDMKTVRVRASESTTSAVRGARKKSVGTRLKAPAVLADFQRWFGRASSRPLLADNATIARGVDGPALRTEAEARLNTVNGLTGLERLEVYNRQYWFRLITIMQEEYPCGLHVLGLDTFNLWVIRYLDAHPPMSPYLADMDSGFPPFLRRRFRDTKGEAHREKVLQAVAYDKALSRAFDVPDIANPVSGSRAGSKARSAVSRLSVSARWTRAGHLTPLWMGWDFATYRALCREDESLLGRFPLKRKGRDGHGVCLHRHDNVIYEKAITRAEFLLLEALAKPRTLDQMFRAAMKSGGPKERAAMERNVGAWFKEWTELGWIVNGG
jgi:hypothetical protein